MLRLDMLEVLDGSVYLLPARTLPRGALDDVFIQSRDLFLFLFCLVLYDGIAELVLAVSQVGHVGSLRLLLLLYSGFNLDHGRLGSRSYHWDC
jgi:hypothetical protein